MIHSHPSIIRAIYRHPSMNVIEFNKNDLNRLLDKINKLFKIFR